MFMTHAVRAATNFGGASETRCLRPKPPVSNVPRHTLLKSSAERPAMTRKEAMLDRDGLQNGANGGAICDTNTASTFYRRFADRRAYNNINDGPCSLCKVSDPARWPRVVACRATSVLFAHAHSHGIKAERRAKLLGSGCNTRNLMATQPATIGDERRPPLTNRLCSKTNVRNPNARCTTS